MFGLGRLFRPSGAVSGDEFGQVCPGCGRYDWAEQPVRSTACRPGVHRSKVCRCGHQEVRFDCEAHG